MTIKQNKAQPSHIKALQILTKGRLRGELLYLFSKVASLRLRRSNPVIPTDVKRAELKVLLFILFVTTRRTLVRRGNAAIKARAEYDFHTLPSRSSEKTPKAD